MEDPILKNLTSLYGTETGRDTCLKLKDLINRYGNGVILPHGITPLTQSDVVLITYGDQVQEFGVAPLQTLGEFLTRHLGDTIPTVHLLPFYPYSSDDGFSVMDYYKVNPALGTWDDIMHLGAAFDLMFDAVINHASAHSAWFQAFLRNDPEFREFFITVPGAPDLSRVVRPRTLPLLTEFKTDQGSQKVWTTFSPDQVDLNFKNPQVLLKILELILFYVSKKARFIRLDAVAFLWKEAGTACLHLPQTHLIIQLIRKVLDEVAPQALLITETNVPHHDNIAYFGNGHNEAQLVYNFALPPLVLHSLATGNAEKLTHWAKTLDLPGDRVTFFNFLASHDGIGLNPARGILSDAEIASLVARTLAHGGLISYKNMPDGAVAPYELNINYFDALSNPTADEPLGTQIRRFICAHAMMLSLKGMPGIYFHSMFGSRGDLHQAKTSGIPRKINRQKLDVTPLEHELADATSLRSQVLRGLTKLLAVRQAHPAFSPQARQNILVLAPEVFAVLRESSTGESVLCLHNISSAPIKCILSRYNPKWRNQLLVEDDIRINPDIPMVCLAPYQTVWVGE